MTLETREAQNVATAPAVTAIADDRENQVESAGTEDVNLSLVLFDLYGENDGVHIDLLTQH